MRLLRRAVSIKAPPASREKAAAAVVMSNSGASLPPPPPPPSSSAQATAGTANANTNTNGNARKHRTKDENIAPPAAGDPGRAMMRWHSPMSSAILPGNPGLPGFGLLPAGAADPAHL